tara:strand:+ start:563 stop:775 length:213 start_codon:yes stop_codon:yes gene_type:complete
LKNWKGNQELTQYVLYLDRRIKQFDKRLERIEKDLSEREPPKDSCKFGIEKFFEEEPLSREVNNGKVGVL